jgi:hypothetical protein
LFLHSTEAPQGIDLSRPLFTCTNANQAATCTCNARPRVSPHHVVNHSSQPRATIHRSSDAPVLIGRGNRGASEHSEEESCAGTDRPSSAGANPRWGCAAAGGEGGAAASGEVWAAADGEGGAVVSLPVTGGWEPLCWPGVKWVFQVPLQLN